MHFCKQKIPTRKVISAHPVVLIFLLYFPIHPFNVFENINKKAKFLYISFTLVVVLINIPKGSEGNLVANAIVASCVLSPSSAIKNAIATVIYLFAVLKNDIYGSGIHVIFTGFNLHPHPHSHPFAFY